MTVTGLRYIENKLDIFDKTPMPFALPQFSDGTEGAALIDPCFWINYSTRAATNTLVHASVRTLGACGSIPYDLFQGVYNKSKEHYNDAALTIPKIAVNIVVDGATTIAAAGMGFLSGAIIGGGLVVLAGSTAVQYGAEFAVEAADDAIREITRIYNA